MRRAFGDVIITAGSALVLVLGLVLFDDRVRMQIETVANPRHPAAAISSASGRAGEIAAIVVTAARDQSLEHAPLVIFGFAATVLVLFMLRT